MTSPPFTLIPPRRDLPDGLYLLRHEIHCLRCYHAPAFPCKLSEMSTGGLQTGDSEMRPFPERERNM
ncbi:MAG: hypothetical protein C4576_21590 [Desulfobacteraceae bacterium]|nr:MAG: hypothetical protein C4576_21590 [Desulfobacteraceae bacterium]